MPLFFHHSFYCFSRLRRNVRLMSRERMWERRQYFKQIRYLTIDCTATWNLVISSLEQLDYLAGTFSPQFGARQDQALMLWSEKENKYA